ncbi:hypothetical protein D3C76_1256910 [compost metagenome]
MSITHILRFVHRQQIAVQDSDIFHGHPANAQQEVSTRFKHPRIDLIVAFNVLLSQQRFTRRNATHQWQTCFFLYQQANTA